MRNTLLGTVAISAFVLLVNSPAMASEKIKLNLGGFSKWWVVGAWNDSGYTGATVSDYNSVDVKGDNEVHFLGSTVLDNGVKVGLKIEMEAGGHTDQTTDLIDESFVFIETAYGKLILGTEDPAPEFLHVQAPDAAANFTDSGLLIGGSAVARPSNVTTLPGGSTTALNTVGDTDKVSYVTPNMGGLTLAASYAPGTTEDNRGVSTANEVYGLGALYAATFGPVGLKLSGGFLTYDLGSQYDSTGTHEFSLGGQASLSGFTLGGSYRKVNVNRPGMSGGASSVATATLTNSTDGQGWDAGVQYASGPWAISAVYFNSRVEGATASTSPGDDEITVYQASGKYNLGAGVDVLTTIGYAEYDDETERASNGDGNHNAGWAAMTGLSVSF